jgi:ubiquinone/menaquinone biosynthesis C-methylase UbiE
VDRALWDYLHSSQLAANYDEALAGSTLFAADESFVLRHCPLPGRLVDLGCGTGRLLVAFARRGYRVVGVDLSLAMLETTRRKAAKARLEMDLVHANIAELDAIADSAFDYAACLFSTLGMLRGAAARHQALAHVHRILRPGGRFVLHVHNRWFNAFDSAGRRWLVRNLLTSLLDASRAGERTMPVHQGVSGLTLHLFTRREAVRLLESEGFQVLDVQPVGWGADALLAKPWLFAGLRAYGYLLAAEKRG